MKVKVPHKVQIGPKSFEIVYKDKVTGREDKDSLCGLCDPVTETITISLTEHPKVSLLMSTVFHETLHGILYITGQAETLTHGEAGTQEEGIIVAMENFLIPTVDWKSSMWGDWKFEVLNFKEEAIDGTN